MTRAVWPTLLRLALLFALAASAALTIDYLSSNPAFCGGAGGCRDVRRSDWGYLGPLPLLGPVPLPALGLIAFVIVLSLSLGSPPLRRAANWLAILGAVLGGVLIVVQALVVKAFCWLCMVADVSAIGAGAAGLVLVTQRLGGTVADTANGPLRSWTWATLGALAVVGPIAWPLVRPAGALPAGVRERHVPGKINVVEFVDFECPFCRMFHPTLKKVVDEYGERVNFIRLDLPLDSHPYARGAAKAHLCAESERAGDRMAEALFESEALDTPGLVATAKSLGLDVKRFEQCLGSPQTEAKLRDVESILRDSGMLQGLPTTFVGSAMFVGALEDVALRDAFERAARGADDDGIPGWAYLAAVVALGAGVVFLGRSRPERAPRAELA